MNASTRAPLTDFIGRLFLIGFLLTICLIVAWLAGNPNSERLAIFFVPALLIFAYALLSFEFTTYIFVFFMFTQIAKGLELPSGFFLVTVCFTGCCLFHKCLDKEGHFYIDANALFILTFVFFLTISILDARWQITAFEMLWHYTKVFLVYFILVDIVRNERFLKNIIWVVIFSAAFSALYGAYNFLTNVQQGDFLEIEFRLRGVSGNPNILAVTLLIALSFLTYYFFMVFKSKTARLFLALAIVAAIVALAATVSRAGIIALGVLIVILTWQFRERKWPVVLFLILATVTAIYMPEKYIEKMALILSPEQDASLRWRMKLYLGAIELIQQHPFNGLGLGNFVPMSINYIAKHLDTHNSFLELWAESGIFSLTAFCGLFYFSFWRLKRYARLFAEKRDAHMLAICKALRTALILVLVCSVFNSLQHWNVVWTLFAFTAIVERIANQKSPTTKQPLAFD